MKKLLYLKDDDLKQYIEKIFLGYRETVSDARNVLNKYSIGVAHNKVIHLISLYEGITCLLYTSPSPRDKRQSRMPSSA